MTGRYHTFSLQPRNDFIDWKMKQKNTSKKVKLKTKKKRMYECIVRDGMW